MTRNEILILKVAYFKITVRVVIPVSSVRILGNHLQGDALNIRMKKMNDHPITVFWNLELEQLSSEVPLSWQLVVKVQDDGHNIVICIVGLALHSNELPTVYWPPYRSGYW